MKRFFKGLCIIAILLLLAVGLVACGGEAATDDVPAQDGTQDGTHPQDEVPREEAPENFRAMPGFYAPVRDDISLFAYRAEDVQQGSFGALLEMNLPNSWGILGGDAVVGATQTIHNVSLVLFDSVWDAAANQDGFTIVDSILIIETLPLGEGILIFDHISDGRLPWSGITFTVEQGERYFFAIHRDNSDSPYGFMLLDITEQMLVG